MTTGMYLEDFSAGQRFRSPGTISVTAESIKAYAQQYDPQPFHLDEEAAQHTFFRGLAASGWQTAGLTMRLLVDTVSIAGGLIGAGFEDFRWPRPTRPGDVLRLELEVLEVKYSQSKPQQGFIRYQMTTLNQNDEPVLIATGSMLGWRRPQA